MQYTTTKITENTVFNIEFDAYSFEDANKLCDSIIAQHHKGKKCIKELIGIGSTGIRYYYKISVIKSSQDISPGNISAL